MKDYAKRDRAITSAVKTYIQRRSNDVRRTFLARNGITK